MPGSSSPQTSTQTTQSQQKQEPWGPQQPYLKQGFKYFGDLLKHNQPSYYPGQTFADFSAPTQAALQMQASRALAGSPLVDAAQAGNLATVTGGFLGGPGGAAGNAINSLAKGGQGPFGSVLADIAAGGNINTAPEWAGNVGTRTLADVAAGKYLDEQNPHTQAVLDRIQAEVLPAVSGQFANSGGQGGLFARAAGLGLGDATSSALFNQYNRERSAMDAAAGTSASIGLQGYEGAANRALTGATAGLNARLGAATAGLQGQLGAAGLASSNFNSERGRMMQGMAIAPDLANQDYYDIAKLSEVGAAMEGKQQQAITEAMNRYNFNMMAPWQAGQMYQQGIGAVIPGITTGNSTTTLTQPGMPLGQMLFGGALGAGSLAAKMGLFGPAGAAAGFSGGFI